MTARTVEGRLIKAYVLGSGPRSLLVMGGVHGNETSSVALIRHFEQWVSHYRLPPSDCLLIVVPDANPDGHARGTRTNADSVDLNRNFPTRDWGTLPRRKGDYPGPRPASEPETRFVLMLIARFHPSLIVSVHAPYRQLNIDGPAMRVARKMHRFNHDPITRRIGYPTPGSLGTYAGKERHVPVITLELASRGMHPAWKTDGAALLAAMNGVCGHSRQDSG